MRKALVEAAAARAAAEEAAARERAAAEEYQGMRAAADRAAEEVRGLFVASPPPPSRTDWTRLVPRPVLIGHAASFTPYSSDTPRRALPATAPSPVPLPTLLCQLISCCMELR